MALEHRVKVTVGDDALEVAVWEQYDIILDLWTVGSPFAFSIPRAHGNETAWHRIKGAIKFGAAVTISIDDSVQTTGTIEDIATRTDRNGSVLTFAGRDLAGPAIDWDASPMVRLRGLMLGDALTQLFTPFGVAVKVGVNVDDARRIQMGTAHNVRARATRTTRRTQRIDRGRPQPGERTWQVAERLCARMGYMLWIAPDADAAMSVIVDVPNYAGGAIFDLKRVVVNGTTTGDSNILSGGQRISIRNVPTEVNVYTGAIRGDSAPARFPAHLENAWIFNPDVMGGFQTVPTVNHPRHIRAAEARTQEAAMREAQRNASQANARARRYECRVQGHGQPFGSGMIHWAINSLAHVHDDWEEDAGGRPLDEDMLIEKVHFHGGRASEQGSYTDLTLHTRGAIVIDAETAGA